MSRSAQIAEIGRNVERIAGAEARKTVMEGSEKITASTKPVKVANWVKGAMERLDAAVDEERRNLIMQQCGRNCALHNKRSMERAKGRRDAFETEEEFLEAEQKTPPTGTRLEMKKGALIQYYTPRTYTRPMRCYCSLMSGLSEDETVSRTYCQCSWGFVKTFWEGVLGRPVEVEILQTAVTGARECAFKIAL